MPKNKIAAKKGGAIAKKARIDLENKTGQKVVSSKSFLQNPKKTKAVNFCE